MRVVLAIGDTKPFFDLFREEQVENVLVSYAYFDSPDKYIRISNNWWPKFLILDSGAFSVWTKGDVIDLHNYADYCKKMRITAPESTQIINVNLDVLPGKFGQRPTDDEREESAKQGIINCERLLELGVKTIPVFHQHEDFKWLELMAKNFEYFGISPANDVHISEKIKWLNKVFSRIKASRKTHGFGATAPQILKQFPFYSADSSSWCAGSRFARIPNFKGTKSQNIHFKDKESFLDNWDKLDVKDSELLTNYLTRARQGIKSFLEMNRFMNQLWDARGIKWNN